MTDNPNFAFWQERFATEEYIFGTAPNEFLASQAALLRPGQSALAVADGEGRNGVWLAQRGLSVRAIEFSPLAQEKARKLAAQAGVAMSFELADVLRRTWEREAYDVVAAIFIQFATPAERAALFANMKGALKPGGHLLLQGYTPKQLEYGTGGPRQVKQLYTASLLRDAFADMDILHLAEHEQVLHEGDRHSGMSALIDMVARKKA